MSCLCAGFEEGAQIAETEGEAAGSWSPNKGCDWIVKHLIERLNMQPYNCRHINLKISNW